MKFIIHLCHELFKRKPYKIVKHTQTIRRQQLTNCLSVFGNFVGLGWEAKSESVKGDVFISP